MMTWLSHPGNVVVNTIYGWSGTFEPDVPVHVPDVAERECRAVGCVDAEPPAEPVEASKKSKKAE